MAASNQRGLVNLYRTESIFHPANPIEEAINIKEHAQIGGGGADYAGQVN